MYKNKNSNSQQQRNKPSTHLYLIPPTPSISCGAIAFGPYPGAPCVLPTPTSCTPGCPGPNSAIVPFLAPVTFFLHKNIPTAIAARRITPSAAPRPIAAPFVELEDLALGVEVEEFEVCEFGAEVPVPVAEEVILVEVERALL
jgi:hypothetical protein